MQMFLRVHNTYAHSCKIRQTQRLWVHHNRCSKDARLPVLGHHCNGRGPRAGVAGPSPVKHSPSNGTVTRDERDAALRPLSRDADAANSGISSRLWTPHRESDEPLSCGPSTVVYEIGGVVAATAVGFHRKLGAFPVNETNVCWE